jgi:hypothetical protein
VDHSCWYFSSVVHQVLEDALKYILVRVALR